MSRPSSVALLAATLLLASCITFNTFRGVTEIERDFEYSGKFAYDTIIKSSIAKGYEYLGGVERLGIIRLKYQFPGTENWGSSSAVMKQYAEPMGGFINPYGRNPFVNASIRITDKGKNESRISIGAHFQTFGEPKGVGGVGPFSLNSKRTWENEFLDKIATSLASTAPESVILANDQSGDQFPTRPLNIKHPNGALRHDDVAVIIGNANYESQGKDIPNVVPAYADAAGMKQYAVAALGIPESNIIVIRDATQADMVSTFGSEKDHRGRLFNLVEPGESKVFVFYAGHGAPGAKGNRYLVPVDARASLLRLNGYRLSTLYRNLGRLPAQSVTVVLEACFSGVSAAGAVVPAASGIYLSAKEIAVPQKLTIIAAGAGEQIASWEKDKSHGLFTKYFLMGMSGEADAMPNGNGDGTITLPELQSYLKGTVTRLARRYYGRDQVAQIISTR